MTHGSLFSGIGGFDLAAEWMGWENIFHCEWNKFGQKVLKYYWPKAISYNDITKTDFTIHRGRIDILSGGFPCQPYSVAGQQKGTEDDRHLWPEMLRAIREIRPIWVVGENVPGLIGWNEGLVFEQVQTDLEAEGYEVQAFILPAAAVNAPHKRERVWFVAYSVSSGTRHNKRKVADENRGGCEDRTASLRQTHGSISSSRADSTSENVTNSTSSGRQRDGRKKEFDDSESNKEIRGGVFGNGQGLSSERHIADTNDTRLQTQGAEQQTAGIEQYGELHWNTFPTQSPVRSRDDGLSSRLDGITAFSKWRNESIKGGGKAIVPQVAHQIFKAIEEYEAH